MQSRREQTGTSTPARSRYGSPHDTHRDTTASTPSRARRATSCSSVSMRRPS